jgi:diguanylate cyclase (GGDEF)-like protein
MVGRLGGEEFAVLLPHTQAQEAITIASRILNGVADLHLADESGQTYRITASLGVGTINPKDRSLRDMLDRADQALYHAKNRGRNQIAVAESSPP